MRRRELLFGLTAAATLLLVAASAYAWTRDDGAGAASGGDQVARGRTLFHVKGCVACHDMLEAGITGGSEVGPDLSSIGWTGGERVEGQSAEEYIRTSILAPDAYYAPGWGGTFGMPQLNLTPAELDAVVAFLLSVGERSSTIGVSS